MKPISKNLFCLSGIILIVSIFFGIANAQTPTVSFVNAGGASVQEGTGSYNIGITIMNPNTNATSVIITHSGVATYGDDYTSSPDTIVFPAGSFDNQFISFTVIDDCVDEPFESVIFKLTNPTNGAQLGISTHTITIIDNDPKPVEDCTYSIPSNAIVVDSAFSFFVANRHFWVCESGELTLESNGHNVLIENGGIVHAKNMNCRIYVKSGGNVIVEDGSLNQIFAEDGAIVTIESGSCNIVFASSGAMFTDNGLSTFSGTLTCAPLDIDYTAAPTNGCILSATQGPDKHQRINIFPNPTSGTFNIAHGENYRLEHIEVFNIQGVLISTLPPQERHLSLSPGTYYLRCVFNDFVVVKELILVR